MDPTVDPVFIRGAIAVILVAIFCFAMVYPLVEALLSPLTSNIRKGLEAWLAHRAELRKIKRETDLAVARAKAESEVAVARARAANEVSLTLGVLDPDPKEHSVGSVVREEEKG